MIYLIILLCAAFSAMFYRMGGKGKPYSSWMRDWICPFFALVALMQFSNFDTKDWWAYLIFYGLSGASLSTYWDFLFKYDNFWFSGFVCGVAGFVLLPCGVPLWAIVTRLAIVIFGWGLWSKFIDNDVKEELGRGFFFVT